MALYQQSVITRKTVIFTLTGVRIIIFAYLSLLPSNPLKIRSFPRALIKYFAMKAFGRVEVQLHAFLKLELEVRGKWLVSRPDGFIPR